MAVKKIDEMSISLVQRLAKIVGPSSAAQVALDKAKEFDNPRFFRKGYSIIVIDSSVLEKA